MVIFKFRADLFKIVIIVLLLTCSPGLWGQELQTFSSPDRYSGKGMLNSSKISVTLDLILRYDYTPDGCISKRYRQIAGQCSYDTLGGGNPLVGEYIEWTLDGNECDSLLLFELDRNYEKTALFTGTLTDNDFKGQWTNLKSNESHPFYIIWEKSDIGRLKINWKGREFPLLDININSWQGTYEVINNFEKDGNLFLIIEVTEPCCGAYNCRGSNCGGENEYLYLYRIGDNEIRTYRELINSSCSPVKRLHTSKAGGVYSVAIQNSEGFFILKIHDDHLEEGIIKKKLE